MHKKTQVGAGDNLIKKKKLDKEKKCGTTNSHSLDNPAFRTQLVDRVLSKLRTKSIINTKSKDYVLKSKKKSPSRVLKVFGASGLAVFMGIGTLLGLLIVPMNSGNLGALNGAAHTQAGLGGEGLNGGAGSENGASGGEAVVLDPESDETIFTTESGFEIKSHNVAGQTLANSKVQYFTLGSYNGTPLNWIILATSPTLAENTTDAGKAINTANANGILSMMTTSNLSANQALVISEKVIPISSYTFTATPKSGTIRGSLPTFSTNGSGWKYGTGWNDNVTYYYSLLLDNVADYYSSYTGNYSNHSSTINSWYTGSNLSLSSYCGNKIVKNSNFNESYYGFAMTNTQITTYIPSSLRTAKDTAGTARAYWCGENISLTLSVGTLECKRVSTSNTDIQYAYATGQGTCSWTGKYINSGGTVTGLGTTTGKLSYDSSYEGSSQVFMSSGWCRRVMCPTATYSTSGTTSITAYYRPAMVVDLSKF